MTTLQTFFGPPATTGVFGAASVIGTNFLPTIPSDPAWLAGANFSKTLSGALTANTYKTFISVSGQGNLFFAAIVCDISGGTARDMSIRVIADGVIVSELTGTTVATKGRSLVAIGSISSFSTESGTYAPVAPSAYGNVRFNKSLSIEAKTSLAETDKIYLLTNYITT